ncbi:hypothetical protein BOX15_Mlig015953g1 [Macrostomum lignano]|uniref:receptor protein serine/threonine kinase n=1 Tax=Macrostomum lignano TaxID=282301 RepID=A0A267EXD1_9PLAT|nr:hypothetical protein BOX15_Mlig015953g1 [Macrostomum lignano]
MNQLGVAITVLAVLSSGTTDEAPSTPSPSSAASSTVSLLCRCNDHNHCQPLSANLSVPPAPTTVSSNQSSTNSLATDVDVRNLLVCKARGARPHCYASKHLVGSRIVVQYGCLAKDSNVLQCIGTSAGVHSTPRALQCCNSSNLCNLYFNPRLPDGLSPLPSSNPPSFTTGTNSDDNKGQLAIGSGSALTMIALVSVSVAFVIVLLTAALYFIVRRLRRKCRSGGGGGKSLTTTDMMELRPIGQHGDQHTVTTPLTNVDSQQEPMTQSLYSPPGLEFSSGSGSGVPKIVQRTIAKEVCHLQAVGRGRFGEVWRGEWRHEDVAVKVFYSTEEASWARESSIYEQCLMRHENVLAFLASDICGTGGWTQMVLITEYHPLGSLHDFLSQQPVLTLGNTIRLLFSAAKGLAFLHTEICGSPGKPALAHRDIKSRNILVKTGGVCCIADLGLAVRYSSINGMIDPSPPLVQGTKRYFAPEILDSSLDTRCFESLTQADMYAFALVVWETLLRCRLPDSDPVPYRLPFSEHAPNDPSVELMQSLVCEQALRPTVCQHWLTSSYSSAVVEMMTECWQHRASARLTSLRVKKCLRDLDESFRRSDVQGAEADGNC